MNRLLPAYFRRRVGLQIAAVLLVLVALMQLLELLDVTTDIVKREQGLRGLAYYALLRAPSEIVVALPLAVLLGTMTALHAMARSLEIMTIRAAGVSLMRICAHLLPVVLVLAAGQFAVSERVLPRSENELKRWWAATAPPDEAVPVRLWAHTAAGAVSIDRASPDGRRLSGVRVYERDRTGMLAGRLSAARARWEHGAWQLDDVTDLRLDDGRLRIVHTAARDWQTNLRPDDVLRLDVARPHLSSMMLADVIAGARVGSQPLGYYRTVFYRSFTAPFGVVVMLLLAMPTAASLARGAVGGREMLAALLLGLGFLLCDGIVATFGSNGRITPLASALVAPAIFMLIGAARLAAAERT